MKRNTLILLASLLFATNAWANDTLSVHSEIKKVVVFLEGAQVKRNAKCALKQGENLINFTKITSHADEKSILVKAPDHVTIQSVSFTINHLDSLGRLQKIKGLKAACKKLNEGKLLLENKLYVLKQEQELLRENQVLGGEQRVINAEDLKVASSYYRQQLTRLIVLKKKTRDKIKSIEQKKQAIQNQLRELNEKKEKPVGEVWVIARANEPGEATFSIEYFIQQAGWKPKYDIRAESVNKPAILSYKADVFQNTDDDWSNVDLVLSSSNPLLGGTKPVLKSWIIDVNKQYSEVQDHSNYNNSVKYYKNLVSSSSTLTTLDDGLLITGSVADENGEAIPGANVRAKGFPLVGTITDLNGAYQLKVPKEATGLVVSFVGMATKELPLSHGNFAAVLESEDVAIDEVVVTALGISREKKALGYAVTELVSDGMGGFVPGSISGTAPGLAVRGNSSKPKPFKKKKKLVSKTLVGLNAIKEHQTSVQFVLDKPYTIPSDNKNYSVDIEKYEVPVNYQYSTVPKLDESAFLLAELTDWESLNLLSGQVNIYFEGSFVGSSNLDVKNTKDTLDISLGRDKAIVIDRKLKKDYSKTQVLSKWKVEEYTWEITVKNTKSEPIRLIVEDQIPVSFTKDLQVELLESSGAIYDEKKGELQWKLGLTSLEKKKVTVSYRIKIKRT